MYKINIKKLYQCTNNFIDVFFDEIQNFTCPKHRKNLIMQLEKLTNLIIKLNKIKSDLPNKKITIDKQDEKILQDILKTYSSNSK